MMTVNLIKKLSLLSAGLVLLAVFVGAIGAPHVHAELFDAAKGDACQGATLGGGRDCTGSADNTLTNTIKAAINLFSVIIGIVAVIMIMVAGFRYITSAGDSNGITSAKHTLIYAIVGLIVAAMAQIIVRFVLSKV